jgi:hypothetical protein
VKPALLNVVLGFEDQLVCGIERIPRRAKVRLELGMVWQTAPSVVD